MNTKITPQLIQTDDGSMSLLNKALGETYHSHFGAVTESKHVFIRKGLETLLDQQEQIRMLEIGFGTGLNALLSLVTCHKKCIIVYETIEKYPVSMEIIYRLNYGNLPEFQSFAVDFLQLHKADWNQKTAITPWFFLTKHKLDLLDYHPETGIFDLVFFDAFSPNVQAELWSTRVFSILFQSLKPGGILVTYSARGSVKTALRAVGFEVKRLDGPPGKRHMLRAKRPVMD